ncbi:MAG: DUF1501 domain-containing protein [Myxococcales bacterium]|nr:DUF1501 domain-containing protein [Myxococcota bacterium]MDW8282411.1 DUF1501 domain-containing protein [Myxococcales bacterium]
MNRRQFLVGSAALLGYLARARAAPRGGPARACIVLWMNGGPSHLDTFDPKPGTKSGGPFRDIPTRVPELRLCEHLPQLAEQAHHLAVVRSLTSREGNHQRAQFLLHTGYAPNPTVDHPALGSWVSAELGDPAFDLPACVSIGGPGGDAGFLGLEHGPFVVERPGQPPDNTDHPPGVDFVRFLRRKVALEEMERRYQGRVQDPQLRSRQAVRDRAVRMMYAPRLRAFDLSEEPDALRTAYGNNDFGRGCLLARRLVEAGVRYVEVVLDGWDTHQDAFGRLRTLLGVLDPAMATLIRDLEQRALLPRTLVLWLGEFGRTPTINANEGRDHHPQAFSAVLCGGGVRGGMVYGATDDEGARVVEHPVRVPDLFATVAVLLGLDPAREVRTPSGRPVSITDGGQPVRALLAAS